ncbi:hypothetical protein TCON_1166 [Astathelohania contejeani]|uniref:Uncharacterized protein n=1 Tax=Astathelohania contejeani TaxID=164912 RepID=A0ABQ7HZP1_9MICR|nr:hypothetical protein TCON_1166 [Thelohania contejeani]
MKIIEKISKARTYGYYTRDYKKYGSHCKSLIKQSNESLVPYFQAEYMLSMAGRTTGKTARHYIKKAVNIISKIDDTTYYKMYLETMYLISKDEYGAALPYLKILSEKIPSFFEEINLMSEMCYKKLEMECPNDKSEIKSVWNDIEIKFNNETEKLNFEKGIVRRSEFTFEDRLSNSIIKAVKSMNSLHRHKEVDDLRNFYGKVKKAFKAYAELNNFLDGNFIKSEYVEKMCDKLERIMEFCGAMEEYKNADFSKKIIIDQFILPDGFEFLDAAVKYLKANAKICPKKLKEIAVSKIEEIIRVSEPTNGLPFLPVTYDIAYDFLEYPKIEKTESNIFSKFIKK